MNETDIETLGGLYQWMVEHRVLHVSFGGVTLTLHSDAIPPLPSVRPDDAKDISWDDQERVSPQEQIRREYAKSQSEEMGP